MARTPDAAKMTDAWAKGMSAGASKWASGVQAYQGNPMAMAAAKVKDGTWIANCTAAQDRMAARLSATDVGFWKSQTQAATASFSQGATKGKVKYQRQAAALAQAAAAGSSAAAGVNDWLEKVRVNANAFRQAFGKSAL